MGQTIREAFAQWLRGRLREQGWMVSDFATAVGVRPSAVYRWTAGQRTPTDAQVEKIAEVLGVPSQTIWDELAKEGIKPIGVPAKPREPRPAPATPPIPPEERPFAKWLRCQLSQREWTTGALARQLGLDIVTVRSWAQGTRTPASVQFPRLAETFNVDVDTVRNLVAE